MPSSRVQQVAKPELPKASRRKPGRTELVDPSTKNASGAARICTSPTPPRYIRVADCEPAPQAMPNAPLNPPSSPATRVRYGVLGFACSLSMLTYLDRACWPRPPPSWSPSWASAARPIFVGRSRPLPWYALFEVPAGWWGDRFGPRRVLTLHRALVVGLHRLDRLRRHDGRRASLRQLFPRRRTVWGLSATPGRHPIAHAGRLQLSVRHGRGGGVSQYHPGLAQLVSGPGARLRPRHRVDVGDA